MRLGAVAVAIACAVGASACGSSSSNPAAPGAATNPVLSAVLTPGAETPPVTNADSSASGQVIVTLTTTKDSSGNVTGATANFQVTVSNFPAGTTLTGAHIHQAPPGQSAGVLLSTGLVSGEVVLASGTGSFTKSGVPVSADIAQGLLNNPGSYYFNVHTSLNPGGAIRGQLARTQ